jgi:hypothetical protein
MPNLTLLKELFLTATLGVAVTIAFAITTAIIIPA